MLGSNNVYSVDELLDYLSTGNHVRYLFFWSHAPKNLYIDRSCLSQWYSSSFRVNDVEYLTAEHYMMAQKAALFGDESSWNKIINATHPGEAKSFGRNVEGFDQVLWDEKKFGLVVDANYMKFNSNNKLKNYLLSTVSKVLVEASPVDCVWGIGLSIQDSDIYEPDKWKGLNMLGFALMKVRNMIQKSQ